MHRNIAPDPLAEHHAHVDAGFASCTIAASYSILAGLGRIAPHHWTPQMRADLAELRTLVGTLTADANLLTLGGDE